MDRGALDLGRSFCVAQDKDKVARRKSATLRMRCVQRGSGLGAKASIRLDLRAFYARERAVIEPAKDIQIISDRAVSKRERA